MTPEQQSTQKEGSTMVDREIATTGPLIDNDQVRVTRFDFTPGAQTGWHRHEYDYVITAITRSGVVT